MANRSRAIAWPFHFGPTGGVAYVDNPEQWAIQRITQLIHTNLGERVMVPSYGTPTKDYLFESNDPTVAAELGLRIQAAISAWEPDITIVSVQPVNEAWETGTLVLMVSFTVSPSDETFTTVVGMGGTIGASESV